MQYSLVVCCLWMLLFDLPLYFNLYIYIYICPYYSYVYILNSKSVFTKKQFASDVDSIVRYKNTLTGCCKQKLIILVSCNSAIEYIFLFVFYLPYLVPLSTICRWCCMLNTMYILYWYWLSIIMTSIEAHSASTPFTLDINSK